ncbi:MAG: 4Fe-4S dicluster domain-containing protein [Anaerolineales bacterium]|nr:4Fe-4S dicluster domain-containing protein [Anaerolineales bacterium]
MCEFCTEHGEGKKWYLQMRNYSAELLHEQLSSEQFEFAGADTRVEWLNNFIDSFVIPATGFVTETSSATDVEAQSTVEQHVLQPSVDEIVRRRKIVHFGQVLPIEDVEEVINIVDSITRLPCGCRYIHTGKSDKRYCFGLGMDMRGILGKYPEASSSLEVLDKEETKAIFRKYDQEGLMHSIWTGVTPYVIGLCNCDRDCDAYKHYIERGGSPRFFRAEYVCRIDWNLCNGCKTCMSQCQFGAQFYSSTLGKVYISPEKCFGCGVCRAACPHDAITLIPRDESKEAANIW